MVKTFSTLPLARREQIKETAAELWLKGEFSETQLKKVLFDEEIKDLTFGKKWIGGMLREFKVVA